MFSYILQISTRYLMIVMAITSVILLLRGHNEVGGGFVGGLMAASAMILYELSYGLSYVQRLQKIDTRMLLSLGLLAIVASTVWPMCLGQAPLTSLWVTFSLPLVGKVALGTPLLFDLGVYIVVFGVVLTIVLSLVDPE